MSVASDVKTRLSQLILLGSLPVSQCGIGLMKKLKPLLASEALIIERFGAGQRLKVNDFEALQSYFRKQYPGEEVSQDGPTRVAGIAQFRNSKAMRNDTPELVVTRIMSSCAIVSEHSTDSFAISQDHGVFTFFSKNKSVYRLNGVWALIENPTLFLEHERVLGSDVSAILLNGRGSNRLYQWLARQDAPTLRLIHCPDYDPVGLDEFLRAHSVLGERVSLYLPKELDELFLTYSSPALIAPTQQQALLRNLRTSAHPEVMRVVALIDRHNAGLEQEAMLV